MMIDTASIVPMAEANQNFSKVVRMVDESGMALILKNNKPKYIVVGFEEYDEIRQARESRKRKISDAADLLITENLQAFKELAK